MYGNTSDIVLVIDYVEKKYISDKIASNFLQVYIAFLVYMQQCMYFLFFNSLSPKRRNYGLRVGVSHSRRAGILAYSMVYQIPEQP